MTTPLMPDSVANSMAAGARRATAAGEKVPRAVSTEAMKKNTHGMRAIRPPTALTQARTITSMVPLACAIEKKKVTPTIVRKIVAGNSSRISRSVIPSMKKPTKKAATKPMMPMFTGHFVATMNMMIRMTNGTI